MSVPKFKEGTIFVGDPPIKLYLTCPICHKKATGTMVITFAKENDPDSMFLPPQTNVKQVSCCSSCGDLLKVLFENNLNELIERKALKNENKN